MPVTIIPMPQLRAGQQGYDFQPLNAGLRAVRQQNNQNAMLDQREQQMEQAARQFETNQAHRNEMLRLRREQFEHAQKGTPVDAARLGLLKSQTALADAKRTKLNQERAPQSEAWGLDERGRLVGGIVPAQYSSNQPAPSGTMSQSVPGVVTTPKGRSDRLATKYNEGNRAISRATPEQQQRLLKHMQVQQMWTRANGRPAKTGHVYTEDGRQVASGALSVGAQRQKSERAISQNAIKGINKAVKIMLKSSMANRSVARSLDSSGAGRAINSLIGNDRLAQAFKDYEQGVLSAVYALSGKTTTNAEMQRFLEAYSPNDGDSQGRIKMKRDRIVSMLRAIQGGMAKGLTFDAAQSKALSRSAPQTPEDRASRDRSAIRERFRRFGVE